VCFDVVFGLVCTDVNSGVIRFAFAQPELADGLGFVALGMAFFGITTWCSISSTRRKAGVHLAHRQRAAHAR
jgi:putative tricarboxylic transport membrane protein